MSFKDILSVLQINSLPKDIFFTFLQRLTKIIAQFGHTADVQGRVGRPIGSNSHEVGYNTKSIAFLQAN